MASAAMPPLSPAEPPAARLWQRLAWPMRHAGKAEYAGWLAALSLVCLFVFYQTRYPLLFLIPPVLIGGATRQGRAAAFIGLPLVATIGLIGTLAGHGPLCLNAHLGLAQRLGFLLLFILSNVFITLAVIRITAENRRIARRLEEDRAMLAASEARFRMLADNSVDMIIRAEADGRISYASPSVEEIAGWKPEEMLGRTPAHFTHPDDQHVRDTEISRLTEDGAAVVARFRGLHKNGSLLWLERRTRIATENGTPFFVSTIRDITRTKVAEDALEQANQKLAKLARVDGLTGIANRRFFDESLVKEWRRAQRQDKPVSLLLLDVDHFKSYNDHYGHQAGDRCLIAVAEALTGFAQRPGDLTARYGGEEFAVILPGCDASNAKQIAERLRASIAALHLPHPGNIECGGMVTISCGIATCHPGSFDSAHLPERLIRIADKLLYEAKRTGRNKTVALQTIATDIAPLSQASEAHRLAVVGKFERAIPSFTEELDNIALMASKIFKVPICLISLVGRDSQAFLGRYGLDVTSISRDSSFCAHSLNGETPFIVIDATEDPRFQNNPLVTGGPGIRFYAGAPLTTSTDGTHLGALCIVDKTPHAGFDDDQKKMLTTLAAFAANCMETHLAQSHETQDLETMAAAK